LRRHERSYVKTTPYSAADTIARKQAGKSLSTAEIEWFVGGSTDGTIPDYQLSAFLMAVFFRGMNVRETRDLTAAMMATGKRLTLGSIPHIKVDKHSTGGVGDKISLIVGPLVASVGVHVPMVSGRALGHTGGTLDKLESIPGFRTNLTPKAFERTVGAVRISIIGQTGEIAPADRKFYALRDVTSTVKCPPLIVSSILSKKIASGADAVVFDIKCGDGAFMKTVAEARDLAGLLAKVASLLGLKTSSILSRMDEPLGRCVGNALEVREVIEVLKGRWVDDLVGVSLTLGSEMLLLAGRAHRRQEALRLLRSALLGGKALQTFSRLIKAQGGDPRVITSPDRLPQARHRLGVGAPSAGYIKRIDALEVGRVAVALGAGRLKADDEVDHAAGIEFTKRTGEAVRKSETLAYIYARDAALGRRCARRLREAITVSRKRPRARRIIIGKATAGHLERLPHV
jgi:pyrimidine-nucleoside phosphorylase